MPNFRMADLSKWIRGIAREFAEISILMIPVLNVHNWLTRSTGIRIVMPFLCKFADNNTVIGSVYSIDYQRNKTVGWLAICVYVFRLKSKFPFHKGIIAIAISVERERVPQRPRPVIFSYIITFDILRVKRSRAIT